MATTEELNAAVEDLRADNYGLSRHDAADKEADQALLAEAYLAHIAEQERVAAERAMPITEAWLVSIGCQFDALQNMYKIGRVSIGYVHGGGWVVWLVNPVRRAAASVEELFTTRGEVLDLLAALKIPTKGA